MPGKPISKSKQKGLAKLAKSAPEVAKKIAKEWDIIQIEWLLKKVEKQKKVKKIMAKLCPRGKQQESYFKNL